MGMLHGYLDGVNRLDQLYTDSSKKNWLILYCISLRMAYDLFLDIEFSKLYGEVNRIGKMSFLIQALVGLLIGLTVS